jgi:DNA-binding protein HU-beta
MNVLTRYFTRKEVGEYMYKTDIVKRVSRDTRLSQRAVSDVVDASFRVIAQTLREGRNVSLLGFGTFYTRKRQASKARHFKSGKEITIPAMRVAAFRPGVLLRRAARKGK